MIEVLLCDKKDADSVAIIKAPKNNMIKDAYMVYGKENLIEYVTRNGEQSLKECLAIKKLQDYINSNHANVDDVVNYVRCRSNNGTLIDALEKTGVINSSVKVLTDENDGTQESYKIATSINLNRINQLKTTDFDNWINSYLVQQNSSNNITNNEVTWDDLNW